MNDPRCSNTIDPWYPATPFHHVKIYSEPCDFEDWLRSLDLFCRETNVWGKFLRPLTYMNRASVKKVKNLLLLATLDGKVDGKFFNKDPVFLEKTMRNELIHESDLSFSNSANDLIDITTGLRRRKLCRSLLPLSGSKTIDQKTKELIVFATVNLQLKSLIILTHSLALNEIFIALAKEKDDFTDPLLCLNLAGIRLEGISGNVFSSLPSSSVTVLILDRSNIGSAEVMEFGNHLRHSQVRRLSLNNNNIIDADMNLLAIALGGSRVKQLELRHNSFTGNNNFAHYLKDTIIQSLDLSENKISNGNMFDFPNFLRQSKVSWLNLSDCGLSDEFCASIFSSFVGSLVTRINFNGNVLGRLSMLAFVGIVKETSIDHVSFVFMWGSLEPLTLLADSLTESSIRKICLCINLHDYHKDSDKILKLLATFPQKTLGSKIEEVSIHINTSPHGPHFETSSTSVGSALKNTTFHRFTLVGLNYSDGGIHLGSSLAHTRLTHLSLRHAEIDDEGAVELAKILPATKLEMLDLQANSIGTPGAVALASSLKSSTLRILNLKYNIIDVAGLKALAKDAENTFITELNVMFNDSSRFLIVESVILRNALSLLKLVQFFKRL